MGNDGRPVTLKDIAERCGVSKVTVSRALRGDTVYSSEATRELIRKVASELGYDPSRQVAARRLALSKTGERVANHVVGLLFYHRGFSTSNYFTYVFQGILDAALEVDFQIQTTDSGHITETKALPASYRKGELDGLLALHSLGPELDLVLGLLRSDIGFGDRPIVSMFQHVDGCSSVHADHHDAGYQAIKHLLDLGHRHIMLAAPYNPDGPGTNDFRAASYRRAYSEIGLDASEYLHPSFWDAGVYEISKKKLVQEMKRHPEVTAFIASHDLDAQIQHQVLVQAGFRIPEDISLISFDDTNSIPDSHGENTLTSVRTPLHEIGYQAVKLLVRRISGEEEDDVDIVLPVELIVRKSTAPPSR